MAKRYTIHPHNSGGYAMKPTSETTDDVVVLYQDIEPELAEAREWKRVADEMQADYGAMEHKLDQLHVKLRRAERQRDTAIVAAKNRGWSGPYGIPSIAPPIEVSGLRRHIPCQDCGGSGDRMPSSPGSCYLCGGDGEIIDEAWCSLRGWVLVNDPAVCWVMWATEEGLCKDNGGVATMTWNEVFNIRGFDVKPFAPADTEWGWHQRLRAFGFLRRLQETRENLRETKKRIRSWVTVARKHLKNSMRLQRELDAAREAWDDMKETAEKLEFDLEVQNDLMARAHKLIQRLNSLGGGIGGVYEPADQWLTDYRRLIESTTTVTNCSRSRQEET